MVVAVFLFASAVLAMTPPGDPAASGGGAAIDRFARGVRAFRDGDYRQAADALSGIDARLPAVRDHILLLTAESEFYAGAPARARSLFAALAKVKTSRLAIGAGFRVADCLWAEGQHRQAGAAYQALLGKHGAAASKIADMAVANFRLAELALERGATAEAQRRFRDLRVEFPAHPLAALVERRLATLAPATGTPAASSLSRSTPTMEVRDRLKRAARLFDAKDFAAAAQELEQLPSELPASLRVERDLALGMAKYRMRRDYLRASELLLGVVPYLSGEKAAAAAFHGARALSRVDRDDQAIAGYQKVIDGFPHSRFAAEAQFLSGWLLFNRGSFREALPGLRATVARYGRTSFAHDASWFIALAHFLLDEPGAAIAALAVHERLAASHDPDVFRRVTYWRARAAAKLSDPAAARAGYRDLATRSSLSYYGLLARAQLRQLGEVVPRPLPAPMLDLAAVKPSAIADPDVRRADMLLAAGLDVEAGVELELAESALAKRVGRDQALALLLDRYPRMHNFHRAYQLAETRGAAVLNSPPPESGGVGAARVFWQAAYPRAFREPVERAAADTGVPDLFLWSIMRKESGFAPHEVSYADARGLLQVLPAVGAEVAGVLGVDFAADELADATINIRLGARYIAGLWQQFSGRAYFVAGAFNAGPRPMQRWCDQHAGRSFDEQVELVAFEQTREYIKRVIGIYAHYRALYGAEPLELPLTLPVGPSPAASRSADGAHP